MFQIMGGMKVDEEGLRSCVRFEWVRRIMKRTSMKAQHSLLSQAQSAALTPSSPIKAKRTQPRMYLCLPEK